MSQTPEPGAMLKPMRSEWAGFAMMCIGMFMAILDVQVVATSLPTIQNALAVPPDQMSWIQTAYLIAEVIAIPLTGILTRMLSMRWLFVASVSIFTVASIGCAHSQTFDTLILWRIVQGASGGTLIPAVFSAAFLLFPANRRGLATTIAGVLAVLAPTVGPIVGGWITDTLSWHWLFLINVAPGIISAGLAAILLPRTPTRLFLSRSIDGISLVLMVVSLSALEIALKEAPEHGWSSGLVLALAASAVMATTCFIFRSLAVAAPLIDLRTFADRNFTIGCILSFVLGIGLFGSVYLMPFFLAFVRHHSAFEIGKIMLVTGLAQLFTAPVVAAMAQRGDTRLLTAAGFALLSVGLGLSAFQAPGTDFGGMFLPQIIRGVAFMFCLIPPTTLALGHLEATRVPDASGLFNLMRNLGGAIGIALIDTVIFSRVHTHSAAIVRELQAGDMKSASFVGIPLGVFRSHLGAAPSQQIQEMIRPLIARAAMTQAINDAWIMLCVLTISAFLCVLLTRNPIKRRGAFGL